eukprot:PhF_6_TR26297/c2_g1_i2/m.37723/K11801/WDR23; WD repeat-containing protein 23
MLRRMQQLQHLLMMLRSMDDNQFRIFAEHQGWDFAGFTTLQLRNHILGIVTQEISRLRTDQGLPPTPGGIARGCDDNDQDNHGPAQPPIDITVRKNFVKLQLDKWRGCDAYPCVCRCCETEELSVACCSPLVQQIQYNQLFAPSCYRAQSRVCCPPTLENKLHTSHVTLPSRGFVVMFTPIRHDVLVATQSAEILVFSGDDVAYKGERARPKRILRASDVQFSILAMDVTCDDTHAFYTTWSDNLQLIKLDDSYTNNDTEDVHECAITTGSIPNIATFSAKFNHDGKIILCGNNARRVVLVDVEHNTVLFEHIAHSDDTNTVCYIDGGYNVFVSGGDDALLKMWDSRLARPCVGLLAGHCDGLCSLDSFAAYGNDKYFLSSSKDQAIKLWDIRHVMNPRDEQSQLEWLERHRLPWDYRQGVVPEEFNAFVSPRDCSVMTLFGGHVLTRTLVKAKFLGNGIVGTGSSNGAFVEYKLSDGHVARATPC